MLKFINKDGKKVMEMKDDGTVRVLEEKLKNEDIVPEDEKETEDNE